ncbi:HEAT repeat domain-containing protein [Mycobacteroides franklinii]|uniref:HEAT repeat domain-containing protein n=1 Tax=Mycobacteroides franklinii TaxID=948102 RepID=UPI0009927D7E
MENIPSWYTDGERGFDQRIMRDLAAVGVPAYTLDDLANGPATIPAAIPVFIDWLANLETRVPGGETEHRSIIRSGLIRNLIDPAARGNQQAIDLLLEQVRRRPPLPQRQVDWACRALQKICSPKDFSKIAALIPDLPPGALMAPILQYLGKVRTPEARDIVVRHLDGPARVFAIKALTQMKASGVRHLIESYIADPDKTVRNAAQRALERLPE